MRTEGFFFGFFGVCGVSFDLIVSFPLPSFFSLSLSLSPFILFDISVLDTYSNSDLFVFFVLCLVLIARTF